MSEGKLNHLSNGGHLLSASTDIIISDIIKFFLIFTINGLSLRVEHSIGCDDSELFRLSSNDFELNWFEVTSSEEEVALLDGTVGILEVWDEISFGEITGNALDSVREGQYVNFGKVWDITSSSNLNDISKANSEIFTHCFIHSDFSLIQLVINECDNKSFFALLSLDEDGISFKDF
jgi:hypothetical protein